MKYACPFCDSENVRYVWVDDLELRKLDFADRLLILILSLCFLGIPLLFFWNYIFGDQIIATHNPNKRSYYDCEDCGRKIEESSILPIPEPLDELERVQRQEEQRQIDEAAFEDARAHYFAEEALKRAGYRD